MSNVVRLPVAPPVSAYDPVAHGARCPECPLRKLTPVPPERPANGKPSRFVVIAEHPGRYEERIGRPLIGPSGQVFDRSMRLAGLDRREGHVTNSILCRGEEGDDLEKAFECCAPRLLRELAEIPADVPILTMGKPATRTVLGVKAIFMARGFVWTTRLLENSIKAAEGNLRRATRQKDRHLVASLKRKLEILRARDMLAGRTVFPTLNSAFILKADAWKPVLDLDIRRFARWIRGELTRELLDDRGSQHVVETAADVEKALARLGKVVSLDIETDGVVPLVSPILCAGLADNRGRVVVIGPWSRRKHARLLTKALTRRTAVMHNGYNFDQIALQRDGVRFPVKPDGFLRVEDTLIAHHAYASHMFQRLDHVGSVFLDLPPWKLLAGKRGEGEKGVLPAKMSAEERHKYNGIDCLVSIRSWDRMQVDLSRERAQYEEDKKVAEICKQMQIDGIRRDEERASYLVERMKRRNRHLAKEMRRLSNRKSFSPTKLADVRKALFGRLHAPVVALTPKGLVSTSSGTLEALKVSSTRVGKFSRHLLDWRAIDKVRSTYIEKIEVLADGRVHPNWKSFGAATGRFSCRLQSVPRLVFTRRAQILLARGAKAKDVEAELGRDAAYEIESRVREVYVPDPGHVFLYFDLCFAEGTLVDGPVGAQPIEKMRLGDLVYTYRASTRKPAVGRVTEVVRVGRAPVVKVTLDNGARVRCTADHKWLVCPERQMDPPVERRADQLRPWDRLLPLRKVINRGSRRFPAAPREYLYAHSAIESSQTHVEVALTTMGPRPPGYHTHHKDDDAMNNAPDNLEYKSAAAHRAEHGYTCAKAQWASPTGRAKKLRGLRRNAKRWREEGTFAGSNNPRFGDRRRSRNRLCATCSKKFRYFANQTGRKYCSFVCYTEARAIKKQCLCCDKVVKRGRSNFCSIKCRGRGLHLGLNHKVVSVVADGYADVWSIAVDPDHNYALAAGVFVKNCQSEARVAAYVSGDDAFIASCESGDVHTANAKILFATDAEAMEVLNRDPKGEGKIYRDITKNAGFGILYKAEIETIFLFLRSKGFEVELADVAQMFETMHETYWKYYRFCDERLKFCQKNGYLRSLLSGRIRRFGFHPKPTEIYNTTIQSFVADLMNSRMIDMRGKMPRPVRIVGQWHDSLVFEAKAGADADETEALIKETWAQPIFVPSSKRTFVMPIDQKRGYRLSDFC